MVRVREDPTKVLRGKVPTRLTQTEPVGHLIAQDVRPVRPLECRFPCHTLLVKGRVSFNEGEGATEIPDGSNRLNEKSKT
jgi:hypothetical protein